MSYLPRMRYGDGISKNVKVQFGGYNHNLYAGDGEIWDMKNMGGDWYPLLAPRLPRYALPYAIARPNGFYARDGLYWVDGTKLIKDGEEIMTVADSEKQFVTLGAFVVILPDKLWYNSLTGETGSIEAEVSGSGQITDGTYAGEEALGNTITMSGAGACPFKVGDAVEISGCTVHPENNKTIIIRELETEGDDWILRFYENSFVVGSGGDRESAITLRRSMPDLDFICENENRLWGCKGDTIYACKLGDIMNWNVFDGVATDSYAVNVGSAGDFTACCSYLGYPCFFKEEHIYKVYGSKPSNYQVMGSASLGVEKGSHRSLAIAGEILFYLSRSGIVAYTGGTPQNISAPFGTERYRDAVAGSDGTKYFVSMTDGAGQAHLFSYDTRHRLWYREDDTKATAFGWDTELYFQAGERIWVHGSVRTVPVGAVQEDPVESMVIFGDFVEGDPNKKGTSKLQMRCELEAGASLRVSMQFDDDGVWRAVSTLQATKKRSFYLPIIPRRSDHFRIKLEGVGMWRLYSLVRENYVGSEL